MDHAIILASKPTKSLCIAVVHVKTNCKDGGTFSITFLALSASVPTWAKLAVSLPYQTASGDKSKIPFWPLLSKQLSPQGPHELAMAQRAEHGSPMRPGQQHLCVLTSAIKPKESIWSAITKHASTSSCNYLFNHPYLVYVENIIVLLEAPTMYFTVRRRVGIWSKASM